MLVVLTVLLWLVASRQAGRQFGKVLVHFKLGKAISVPGPSLYASLSNRCRSGWEVFGEPCRFTIFVAYGSGDFSKSVRVLGKAKKLPVSDIVLPLSGLLMTGFDCKSK